MKIVLRDIGRKFGTQTIFQNINYTFEKGESYALLGGNGSGKSTLLKIIYSALSPTSGKLEHYSEGVRLKQEIIPFKIAIAAPYFELIEELTALEFLDFYRRFKEFPKSFSSRDILTIAKLEASAHKKIENFSSGMKQRLRLSVALLSSSELILLDEPVSNLDPEGVEWYQQLLQSHLAGRSLIIGSNFNEDEIFMCQNHFCVPDYK